MPGSLNILCPRDLDLDIWPVLQRYLFLNILLLPRGTVEILRSLVQNLIRGSASHGQVNVLSGASPSRACPSFRSVVSISFHTFNKLSCFRVDFREWVHCVVLVSLVSYIGLVSRNSSLDQGSITSPSLGCVWNIMKVRMAATAVMGVACVGKHGLRFLVTTINS